MANLKGILDAAGDGPLTFGQRLAGDPRIARVIEGNLPALSQIDPQLAARLQQRDPEAIFEAYQMIVGSGGRLKAPAQPDPFANIAPDDGVGNPMEFAATTDKQMDDYIQTRQMELPLSDDPVEAIRALIPFGSRGPGVAVGGPSGSGVPVGEPSGPGILQFAPPSTSRMELGIPPRPEPRPTTPRLGTTAWTRGRGIGPTDIIPHPTMGGPRDLITVPPPRPMSMADLTNIALAGGVAGGGGLLVGERIGQEFMRDDGLASPRVQAGEEPDMPLNPDDSVDMQSGDLAALAAEMSPPPDVSTLPSEEQAFVDLFKDRYMAREARREAAVREGRWPPKYVRN
jgi:hypothetical protein